MTDRESILVQALRVLEVAGVVLGLLIVAVVILGIARSIWRVTFGRSTLVLPFAGSEKSPAANEILAQQLGEVESSWQELSRDVQKEEKLVRAEAALVDLGPRGRAVPDRTLDEQNDQFITEQPLAGLAISPITFGGITVSPETVFNLFYRLRRLMARRTIHGTLHEFDATARLSALFVYRVPGPNRQGHRPRWLRPGERTSELVVLVRDLHRPGEILELIDDLAFRIAKARLGFTSEASRWSAYRAFLEGYAEHVRFLRSGKVEQREIAIRQYSDAVAIESTYYLAHYNLGSLMYNRYREEDNAKAIEHLRAATHSPDERLRALALALLTLACAQNVHRFGLPPDPWVGLADETSRQAVELAPGLEETSFARGWAHQIAGRVSEAMAEYERTIALPGDTPIERQVKSFAQNNRAWLHLNVVGDLDTAEGLLRDAIDRFPNKMAHANLGEIYKRRREFGRALEEYEIARSLDPGYSNAINETGMVYLAMAREAMDRGLGGEGKLLEEAERWHGRALDTVSAEAGHERDQLQRRFEAARSDLGLATLPGTHATTSPPSPGTTEA